MGGACRLSVSVCLLSGLLQVLLSKYNIRRRYTHRAAVRVRQVATPGKCGGKGSAFKKPGPDERFKAGVRLRAREYAMSNDRGHDARYQLVVDAIDKHGPSDGWRQRAKLNVTPFYTLRL